MAAESNATPEAWEKQVGEPDEAWQAFQNYRDQTPPRRWTNAAVKRHADISRWYNEWKWGERCEAYDRHLDAMRRATREAILKEDEKDRAARQLAQIKTVQDIVDRELAKLDKETRETAGFGYVKVTELNKLLVNSITLERLIRGQATDKVDVDVNLDALSPDDLRTLLELRKKMGDEG
jgi:hypothetical protein